MKTSYYGLICRHCNGGYPLGEESLREIRYLLNRGPFALDCVRCGTPDVYDQYVHWLREDKYTATQIATARLRVSRA